MVGAHAANFSAGVEKRLKANAEIENTGLRLLPFEQPKARLDHDIEARIVSSASGPSKSVTSATHFDVVLSFAGTERSYAEKLALLLKEAGYFVSD
jgi:hypothetical protein